METKVKAIHFVASQQLDDFVQKKVSKLNHFFEGIISAEVVLKVEKPEAAQNKNASIKLIVPNGELFAEKTADTFEEAVDDCCSALEKQLAKHKEKFRKK